MATADGKPKAPERDESPDSGSGSDSDDASDSGEQSQIEWLATSRAKRSTAGNRMKSMLANEEPAAEDDDLELLFVEDADDAGFTDVGKDDSDEQMDSSSDDEDQDGHADDLEGEKELERQAKEKRAAQRKRKAQEAIPAKFRKKVRIEQPETRSATPSSTGAPSQKPRPKKKSERLSWFPSPADLPTRSSDRKTTRISKEQLHKKMAEDEVKRKKLAESMAKKQARLEALKKPPMTQEERLAEAALVEKRNSKSLNRWEEAEKQREEERLRKIAALHSRKLDGPVVTFYSGNQELEEGLMKHVGKMVSIEEKVPRQPRKKKQLAADAPTEKAGEDAKEGDGVKAGEGAQEGESVKEEVAKEGEPTKEGDGVKAGEGIKDEEGFKEGQVVEGEEVATGESATVRQPLVAIPAPSSDAVAEILEEPGTAQHEAASTSDTVFPEKGAKPVSEPQDVKPATTAMATARDSNQTPAVPAQTEIPISQVIQEPAAQPVSQQASQPVPQPTEQESQPPTQLATQQAAQSQPTLQSTQQPSHASGQPPAPVLLQQPTERPLQPPAQQPQQQTSAQPSPPPTTTMPPPVPMARPVVPSPPEAKPNTSGVLAAPVLAPPLGVSAPMLGGQMPMLGFAPQGMKSNVLAPPNASSPGLSPLSLPVSTPTPPPPAGPTQGPPPAAAFATASVSADSTAPASLAPAPQTAPLQPPQRVKRKYTKRNPLPAPEPELELGPEPPMEGKVTRSCIILQDFDEEAIKDKQVQSQVLFGRRMSKLAKPAQPPLCAITSHAARYKDPKTGLPFYNVYAFKEIQRLHQGDYKYSRLIGGWVGPGTYAARGVPERFLDPTKKRKVEDPKADPKEAAEGGKGKEDCGDGQARVAPGQATEAPGKQAGPAQQQVPPEEEVPDAATPTPAPAFAPAAAAPASMPAPLPAPLPTPASQPRAS